MWANHKSNGFTVTELLIVIATIAILAAITIVAYSGVQNKAYDAAVRVDLANIAKKYDEYRVNNFIYPYGTPLNDGTAFKININKSSYDTTKTYQLLNCTSSSSPGSDYAVLAMTKGKKRFYVSSTEAGVKEYTAGDTWLEAATCPIVLPGSTANGAGYAASAWRAWTSL